MKIATVIPYFQRKPGILAGTLGYALAQEGVEQQIIIVDDSSPVPARDELARAGLADDPRIRVLTQPNAGPGTGRNRGLDNLPDDAEAVALLDSDDRWPPDHLARAARGLANGYDVYFADHQRDGWETTKFQRIGFDPATMPEIPGTGGLREFTADLAPFALLQHGIQTSTIVVRSTYVEDLRFAAHLRAFDDNIMWAKMGRKGGRICFSPHVESFNAEGVNISISKGPMDDLRVWNNWLRGWKAVPDYITLDADFGAARRERMRNIQKDIARVCLFGGAGDGLPASARVKTMIDNSSPILRGLYYAAIDRLRHSVRHARITYYLSSSRQAPFEGSSAYWEARYAKGGNSGVGSYDKFATFKAEVINGFVTENRVASVIEFGCGDGNQLTLADYPRYIGFDVSPTAIEQCQRAFKNDQTKSFKTLRDYDGETADLTLSLDVIYHLVEDPVFDQHLHKLFKSSNRFVIIYASNKDDNSDNPSPHVKHRHFTPWIEKNFPDWALERHLPNRYPYKGNYKEGSFADFYIYARKSTGSTQ